MRGELGLRVGATGSGQEGLVREGREPGFWDWAESWGPSGGAGSDLPEAREKVWCLDSSRTGRRGGS